MSIFLSNYFNCHSIKYDRLGLLKLKRVNLRLSFLYSCTYNSINDYYFLLLM